ncbi:MAG: IPT/TIG domain-containing protein [Thermoleophilaceae bacterium]|nr:IPT/TIG domain-containing protein [Thermoleophilaceae bacterium]
MAEHPAPGAGMSSKARSLLLTTSGLAGGVAFLAPFGVAQAEYTNSAPTIQSVSAMRAKVGKTITIRGKSFSAIARANTVSFRGPDGRVALAKPSRASHTALVVRVPDRVERLLVQKDGRRLPTRFKLRVITGRYGKLSARRHSPVIVSAACATTAVACPPLL